MRMQLLTPGNLCFQLVSFVQGNPLKGKKSKRQLEVITEFVHPYTVLSFIHTYRLLGAADQQDR